MRNHTGVLDFSAPDFSPVAMFKLKRVLLGDVSSFLAVTQRSWFVTEGPTGGSDTVSTKQAEASD